ncbi:hypothetical protein HPB50_004254 [Hyalomma asiaticum]|uniref:Uncharacterized protein n=1 Tax=Hyalomma asiaticum TaxID=266040 RepID=A0ACB7TEY3_HYAAI|nr:hypothetical protein HPB50_004254 [Hyalomma asiaticum]
MIPQRLHGNNPNRRKQHTTSEIWHLRADVGGYAQRLCIEQEPIALDDFASTPKILIFYVNDCFYILNRNDASRLLRLLNSTEAAIQFTAEYERDSSLPFLDFKVELTFRTWNLPTTGTYFSFAVHSKCDTYEILLNV